MRRAEYSWTTEFMKAELAPCPHCGGKVAAKVRDGVPEVDCRTCHTTLVMWRHDQSPAETWNRRHGFVIGPRGGQPPATVEGFPRRSRIDLLEPLEKELYDVMQHVEEAGADPLLTDAVVLLAEARERVADWLEKRKGATA